MTINLAQARDLLKRAVATQGREFVYNPGGGNTCLYTPLTGRQGDPDDPRRLTGCMIGVALDLAGVTVHHGVHASVFTLFMDNDELMTPAVARYFGRAQVHQDQGDSWGIAYDNAESMVALLIESFGDGV